MDNSQIPNGKNLCKIRFMCGKYDQERKSERETDRKNMLYRSGWTSCATKWKNYVYESVRFHSMKKRKETTTPHHRPHLLYSSCMLSDRNCPSMWLCKCVCVCWAVHGFNAPAKFIIILSNWHTEISIANLHFDPSDFSPFIPYLIHKKRYTIKIQRWFSERLCVCARLSM